MVPSPRSKTLDRMSQTVARLRVRAFMRAVNRPPETDACARWVASGRVLFQVIVLAGIVACALLLAGGPPPASDRSVSGGRDGAAVAQVQVTGVEAVPAAGPALAWSVAEIDDVSGDPRIVEPAPGASPRSSVTGFRPRGDIALRARGAAPPDRPPRRA